MSRVTGSIPNLFNGVSQQTSSLRLPTQGLEQVNMYPSLVQGLVKRPPLEIISDDLNSALLTTDGTIHLADRGGDSGDRERCILYITDKGITAFRPDGSLKEVKGNFSYLAKNRKRNDGVRYPVLTIADHTFIANPCVPVRLSSKLSPKSVRGGFMVIKQAGYDTTYKLDFTLRDTEKDELLDFGSTVTTYSSQGTVDNVPPRITIGWIVRNLIEGLGPVSDGNSSSDTSDIPYAEYVPEWAIPLIRSGDIVHHVYSNGTHGNGEWTPKHIRSCEDDAHFHVAGGHGNDEEIDDEPIHSTNAFSWRRPKNSDGTNRDKITVDPADADRWTIEDDSLPYSIYTYGNVIYVYPKKGYELVGLRHGDSEGNQFTTSFTDKTEKFANLPKNCVNGTIIKITGDDTTRFNDYYVKFNADPVEDPADTSLIRAGTWQECPAPQIPVQLDPSAMPYVLRDDGTHFTFTTFNWAERTCGDDDTCPVPDFIGQPITGLFAYRNRLGILSEDVVTLSEASQFSNFWNTTAMTQVDSDPISLSASVEGAPTLRYALPFNEEIILFSDHAQFKLAAPDILSPASAAINTVTNYDMNNNVRPVHNGRNIFFVYTQKETALDKSAKVYEYYIDTDSGTKAAMDITSHVPQYIRNTITDLACSSGLSLLCAYEQNSTQMFMYKYYWSGNEKLQAAWFETCTNGHIFLGAVFIGDVLYCLMLTKDGNSTRFCLCKMDFSVTLEDHADREDADALGPRSFPVYLDMQKRYRLKGIYDASDNLTRIEIPKYYDRERVVIVNLNTMRELRYSKYDAEFDRLCFMGEIKDTDPLVIGEHYDAHYTFSHAFVRGGKAGGESQMTVHTGRLQLQHWRLVLGPTGYLASQVRHADGRVYEYPVVTLFTNYPFHLLGRVNFQEFSTYDIPVRGEAKLVTVRLTNPTWFPSTVVSAEWDANYITKGRQYL